MSELDNNKKSEFETLVIIERVGENFKTTVHAISYCVALQ